ncbi:MAG: hypothetical protein JO199_05730 [Candidatus Eremiobacteraeota bacterium]|nr:hypothetical protein [Candidatus Eremiobacteraeota bacterium]
MNVVDRAKDAVSDRVDNVREMAGSSVRGAQRAIGRMIPSDNPMGMLMGGLAIGFLLGMIVPVTEIETERLKPIADDVKDRVMDAGAEAVRRGQEVIKESIDAARDAAVSTMREQASGQSTL